MSTFGSNGGYKISSPLYVNGIKSTATGTVSGFCIVSAITGGGSVTATYGAIPPFTPTVGQYLPAGTVITCNTGSAFVGVAFNN